ncbi:MAG: DUF4167 domain-containing protein [Paracoccaceae bacterium]|nr:DUF4167 domain-containing protein [Paracoccaceae bacterium]
MRSSQKPNRTRGRGGRKPSGNNLNRVYESAGPEGKVRGTPQQIIDKYLSLARDAQTSGDRVVAEDFLQHAEHYQRILVEAMGARQERRDAQQGDGEQPHVAGTSQTESGEAQANGADAEARGNGRDSPRESEVSGLTMIDAEGGDAGSLLIEAEDLSASQPKRRRRPARDQQADGETAEPETPAE